MIRATVDLDEPSELGLLRAYFTLRHYCPVVNVERSPGGRGYHLEGWAVRSRAEEDVLRRLCGDDPCRLRFDQESPLKPKRILFQWKDGGRAVPLDIRNVLSLPWKVRRWRKWPRETLLYPRYTK
jgi:hypothetical protein